MAKSVNEIYKNVKNPYEGIDPQQQRTGWQEILDNMGITNYAGRYDYQHQLASAQWDSENAARMADVEYNSIGNQVEMQRQAGINPDLNGVQGYEANTSGNPMNTPQQVMEHNMEPLQMIGRGLFQGIQMAIGISDGILGIGSRFLANRKSRQELFQKDVDTLVGELANVLHYKGSFNSKENFEDLMSWANQYTSHINGRNYKRKVIEKAISFVQSPEGRKRHYETVAGEAQARTDYNKIVGDPFYSDFDEDMQSTIHDFNKLYIDVERLNREFQKSVYKLGIKDADYKIEQEAYKVPVDLQKVQAQFQQQIQSEMSNFFQKQLKKDNLWTDILLASMFSNQTGAANPMDILGGILSGGMKLFK